MRGLTHVMAVAAAAACAAASQVLSFTAPASGKVVAGLFAQHEVYNQSVLVRQLSIGTSVAQGERFSIPLPVDSDTRPWQLRAFIVNTTYTWEGVIGNTGDLTGPYVWRGLNQLEDVAFAYSPGNDAVVGSYAVNYNEMQHSFGMFLLNATSSALTLGHADYHRAFPLTATDGELAYFANSGVFVPNSSFFYIPTTYVVGINLTSRCEWNFTVGGVPECEEGPGQPNCTISWDGCNGAQQYWSSTLDRRRSTDTANGSFADAPTGLAVQQGGTLLAVAHAFRGTVHVFDKRTGASVCNASLPEPRSLAFDPAGDLWAVTDAGVTRYALPADCTQPWQPVLTLSGITVAGALSVAPGSGRVFVADLGTQQVRIFNGTTGAPLTVIGTPGGYTTLNATVDANRLWFMPALQGSGAPGGTYAGRGTFIAVEPTPEETIWVGDAGNRRVLRFNSSSGASLGVGLGFVVEAYRSVVHPVQTFRVFANFLEFNVEYSLPLNESWTLVRNWGAGLPPSFSAMDAGLGIMRWAWAGFSALGFANNVTVATVSVSPYAPLNGSNAYMQLVQLMDDSDPPYLAMLQTLQNGAGELHTDGSLRYTVDMSLPDAAWQEIWQVPLTLNSSGFAEWTMPGVRIAAFNVSLNTSQSMMARTGGVALQIPVTDDGLIVLLDATTHQNGGAHLAAIPVNGSALLWQASPWGKWGLNETQRTYVGPGYNITIPYRVLEDMDGRYGANDSSINYAACFPVVCGGNIVYGFFGEGWSQGETNQFLHFDAATGLFLGQFGTLNFPDSDVYYALPGAAGNSFAPSLVPVPGGAAASTYLYHNDESAHAGIHRWRIDTSALVEAVAEGV